MSRWLFEPTILAVLRFKVASFVHCATTGVGWKHKVTNLHTNWLIGMVMNIEVTKPCKPAKQAFQEYVYT